MLLGYTIVVVAGGCSSDLMPMHRSCNIYTQQPGIYLVADWLVFFFSSYVPGLMPYSPDCNLQPARYIHFSVQGHLVPEKPGISNQVANTAGLSKISAAAKVTVAIVLGELPVRDTSVHRIILA